MKKLLLLLLMGSALAFGQASGTFYGAGAAYVPQAHPAATGLATYAVPLNAAKDTFSYTTYEVIARKATNYAPETSIRSGIATQIKVIGPIRIFALFDGGYSIVANSAGASGSMGFFATIPIDRQQHWYVIPITRILKTSITPGTPKIYELEIGYKF